MTISAPILWGIVALLLLGLELVTGTFYLLVVALGCVAGGIVAVFTSDVRWAIAACALVTIVGAMVVSRRRRNSRPSTMDFDSGERVEVRDVNAKGEAEVQYRGAPWVARAKTGVLVPGTYAIERVDGARLILVPVD